MSRRKVRKVEVCTVTFTKEERDLVLHVLGLFETNTHYQAGVLDGLYDRLQKTPLIAAKIEE